MLSDDTPIYLYRKSPGLMIYHLVDDDDDDDDGGGGGGDDG